MFDNIPWVMGAMHAIQDKFYDFVIGIERRRAGLVAEQVQAGEVDFAVLRGGTGGDVILMVHGFAADKDSWLYLASYLKGETILIPDLSGHGESSQTVDIHGNSLSFLIQEQVERLAALLDQQGIERVHFIGNSMGGAIGLQFAASYPNRLLSLVLLDNAGIASPRQSEFFALLDRGENPLIPRKQGDYRRFLDFVMGRKPFMPWPVAQVLERRALARVALNDKIFADMLQSRDEIGTPEQMERVLRSIKIPSLVIWGEQDRVVDISSIEVMKNHMSDLRSITLAGVGHVPMLEVPKQVASVFREFISGLPRPANKGSKI